MDWRDWELFCEVVQHGGFSAAARVLGHPKSSLSAAVQRLETHLGLRLIERTTRHLRLTDAGDTIYRRVQPLFIALHETKTRSARHEQRGRRHPAHQIALRIRRASRRPRRLRIDGAPSRSHHPDRCRARDRQSRRGKLRHRVRDAGGAAAVGRDRDPARVHGGARAVRSPFADRTPWRAANAGRSCQLPLLAGPSDTAWPITPPGGKPSTSRWRRRGS